VRRPLYTPAEARFKPLGAAPRTHLIDFPPA
jgi:hypothetical protein